MSNVHRLKDTDKIFFITTNLIWGTAELVESEFEMLLQVFSESRNRLGFVLLGYVFMPDHFHALLWPRHPLTISRVLQDIKYCSSRNLNRVRGTAGTVWQHQFSDRFVRDAEEFQQRLEYMHYNPVRKGLVANPEEWRWSSYNNFALEPEIVTQCPIQIDYVHLPDNYRV